MFLSLFDSARSAIAQTGLRTDSVDWVVSLPFYVAAYALAITLSSLGVIGAYDQGRTSAVLAVATTGCALTVAIMWLSNWPYMRSPLMSVITAFPIFLALECFRAAFLSRRNQRANRE